MIQSAARTDPLGKKKHLSDSPAADFTTRRGRRLVSEMHILVFNSTMRCAVVLPASATVLELKEKVAKQTAGPGPKHQQWPVEEQLLLLRGEPLADEMTLGEQGIVDRDRIELQRIKDTPLDNVAARSDESYPGAALTVAGQFLIDAEEQLLELEAQVNAGQSVHQEHFTRLLERLDGVVLDGCASLPGTLSTPLPLLSA